MVMNIMEWLQLYEMLDVNQLAAMDVVEVLGESKRKCTIVFDPK